jgi:hypothetical protein
VKHATVIGSDVLAVNQHSTQNKLAYQQGDIRVWTARSDDASARKYVAVFNLGDSSSSVHLSWNQVGIQTAPLTARELWTRQTIGKPATLNVTLAPHASAIYQLGQE